MRIVLRGSLVDSNVLVYAYDPSERFKQMAAISLLDELIARRLAILSVQCLTEYFNTVRLKLPQPIDDGYAIAQVEYFVQSCTVLDLTATTVVEACRVSSRYQMSIWDALIWSIARLNQVGSIITEDGQHGSLIEGVRYLNPFHADFDLEALVTGA